MLFLDFFGAGIFVGVEGGGGNFVDLEAFVVGSFLVFGGVALVVVFLAERFVAFVLIGEVLLFFFCL